jgi:hypothetical protein
MKFILLLGLSIGAIAQTPAAIVTVPVTVGPWEKVVTLPAEALPYFRIHLGNASKREDHGWLSCGRRAGTW